jgi:hypothetical protein
MVGPPKDPKQPAAAGGDDWDDLLGEAKQSGISPEMARALLSMNPKMREEGKNTAWVVSSGQKAAHQSAQLQQTPAAKPGAGPAAKTSDLFSEIDTLKRKLELDEQQVDQQIKALQEAKTKLKQDALDQFQRALLGKDPELLSPMTQQALADRKSFLDRLGFSVKAFVEFKRKHGAR